MLTIGTCLGSPWKTTPNLFIVQGREYWLKYLYGKQASPKHHKDFECEQIPVSE